MKTTKEQILINTAKLIVSKGYGSVSMRDIAGACGILASSLFAHFKNKEAIIKLVSEKFILGIQDPAIKLGDTTGMSLEELIDHYSGCIKRTHEKLLSGGDFTGDEKYTSTLQMHYVEFFLAAAIDFEDIKEKFYGFGRQEAKMFESAIQISIDKGTVRSDIDVHETADLFRRVFVGGLYEESFNNWLDEEKAKELFTNVYNLIKK